MKPSPRHPDPASLSDSLHRQLNSYALAASAAGVSVLALIQHADAKIIYTATHVVIAERQSYRFDLTNSGQVQFLLSNLLTSTEYGHTTSGMFLGVHQPKTEQVYIHYSSGKWWAAALRAGAKIGSKAKFSTHADASMETYSEHGPWLNVKGRYLGLRFQVGGEVHYGWARLNVSTHPVIATLTGYAYETIPNKPIIAGQTKGPNDDAETDNPGASITNPVPDIPQPATLGALALGAPGLAIWRREESVADGLSSN